MDWQRSRWSLCGQRPHPKTKENPIKLYELTSEFRVLAESLAESETGELTPEQSAKIDANCDAIELKVGNCVAMYREFEVESEAIKAESDRLAKIAARRLVSSKGLKAYVTACLDDAKIKSVQTIVGRVQIQDASKPSIRWLGDVEKLPQELKRITTELNGTEAYALWKTDRLPEGFEVKRSRSPRVY